MPLSRILPKDANPTVDFTLALHGMAGDNSYCHFAVEEQVANSLCELLERRSIDSRSNRVGGTFHAEATGRAIEAISRTGSRRLAILS